MLSKLISDLHYSLNLCTPLIASIKNKKIAPPLAPLSVAVLIGDGNSYGTARAGSCCYIM
jgi:hypothetical protein